MPSYTTKEAMALNRKQRRELVKQNKHLGIKKIPGSNTDHITNKTRDKNGIFVV